MTESTSSSQSGVTGLNIATPPRGASRPPSNVPEPFRKRDKIPLDSVENSPISSPVKTSFAPTPSTSRSVSFEELTASKNFMDNVNMDVEEGSLETLIRIFESLPIEERPLPTVWNRMKREVEQREVKRLQQEAANELMPRAAGASAGKRRPQTIAEERSDFVRLRQFVESGSYDPTTSSPVPAMQGIPKRGESHQPRLASPTTVEAPTRTSVQDGKREQLAGESPRSQEGYLWGSGSPSRAGKLQPEPKSNCSCAIL